MENVTGQHQLVAFRIALDKTKRVKLKERSNWWKLKKEFCKEFSDEYKQALDSRKELPDDWESKTEVVRKTAKRSLVYPLDREKRISRLV